ncbi:MAG: class I SAM-dependent methyltransferase [Candidatus Aramenus sp.]|nr:class I SAM-dependent methyltransferase [Candidatus Aramenus sp.]
MGDFRVTELYGYKLCVNEEVYEPAEDSELLLDVIQVRKGERVVEMGSGTGILSVKAAKLGGVVLSIDLNPFATEATLCTAKLNGVSLEVVNCDMFTCIRDKYWDVAIFNPPYLPVSEYRSWIEYSWSGGDRGVEVLLRFLNVVKAKRVYILYSSLDDEESIMGAINSNNYIITRKEKKYIGFEELIALELNDKGSASRA